MYRLAEDSSNVDVSEKWNRRAAKAGHVPSMLELARRLQLRGEEKEAAKWKKRATEAD